ncbi:MAG: LytTR family transcriptional regulator [Mariniphaga sp.]|nr:LytTR family transcriptional regulator [Mariniphaga sp.]
MDNKLNQIIKLFKDNLTLYLSISIGVFLFVLFFQPFILDRFDFNNRLLFIAGLGAIVFLFMVLVRITFNRLIQKHGPDYVLPAYLSGFIMLILNSLAFTFYLRYVGNVEITFYVMFKIIVICLSPSVILRLYDLFKGLKVVNDTLQKEKGIIQTQLKEYKEDYLNKTIEFVSENKNEQLKLQVSDIIIIQSADNYVEIIFKEPDSITKKLIRNSLKNIEFQLKPFSNFIRCHRTCIVNKHYIEKLNRNYQKQWLTLKGISEKIPISRQYLSKLQEIIV